MLVKLKEGGYEGGDGVVVVMAMAMAMVKMMMIEMVKVRVIVIRDDKLKVKRIRRI